MSEFFSMGGYALYVWGAYAVTFGLIAAEVVVLVVRKRNITRDLRARAHRGGGPRETAA